MDSLEESRASVNPELRNWLAGRLRRAAIPDWLWEELSAAGLLKARPQQLIREAKRRIRAIRPDGPIAQAQDLPDIGELLTPAERSRAWAYSEHIAGLATDDRDVHRFRETHLNGRALTHADAVQFLASEALRYLPTSALRSKGVPLIGHRVTKSDPKGGQTSRPWGPMWRLDVHLEISWDGGSASFDPSFESSPGSPALPKIHLLSGDQWFPYDVWPGSVYDELRKVTESLVKAYPWNEPEATTYVLTGLTPFIPPIYVHPIDPKIGAAGHLSVTISVEPWVSAETMTRVYKLLKSALYPGKSRALSEKNVALFRFVTQHAAPGGEIPSFDELLEMWNAEQEGRPEWQYKSVWTLSRDYRRTGHMIVFPRYGLKGE